ncbi:MAG: MMPL family transporter, partial [Planctomycetaceae bacterium]
DMIWASVVSFVGVGVLLVIGFRGVRHPALGLAMLAVGMAWAFGYTTFAVGHLNILSVSFAVMLIGLGIDFAVHFISRYLELRQQGRPLRPALLDTASSVGTGIVAAAVTTALAFFCATFTPFRGIAELGIIAGGGILLCAAAAFIALPAMIALADRNVDPKRLPVPFRANALRALTGRFPLVALIVSAVIVAGIGSQALRYGTDGVTPRVRYDYNLLNLQAEGVESVELQKRVFEGSQSSLLFAVSVCDGPEEARRLRRKFEALPTVHHVQELASSLPSHRPEETRLLVQAYRAQLSRLPARPPQQSAANPSDVGRAMEQMYQAVRYSRHPRAKTAALSIDQFLDRFERLPAREQSDFLTGYQARMTAALYGQFQALRSAANAEPVTFDHLPPELTARFVSPEGKWLVQIYPKEQVWDVEPLTRFVEDLRSVDPEVTGTPLQNFEASRQIRESYERAALYALVVIVLVLLIDFLDREYKLLALLPPLIIVGFTAMSMHIRGVEVHPVWVVLGYLATAGAIAAILDFRNFRDAVLAMLPPLCGGVLMFGVLGLLGVHLNPANLIVLPLILGIGVDSGVLVLHDFRGQSRGYATSPSMINAIVLTALTSMVGFGSMMLAAHRGLFSVGVVMVVGLGSCLLISLVMLPAILTLISRRNSSQIAGGRADDGDTAAHDRSGSRHEGHSHKKRRAA